MLRTAGIGVVSFIFRKAEDSELVSLASKSSGVLKHKTAFGKPQTVIIMKLISV